MAARGGGPSTAPFKGGVGQMAIVDAFVSLQNVDLLTIDDICWQMLDICQMSKKKSWHFPLTSVKENVRGNPGF